MTSTTGEPRAIFFDLDDTIFDHSLTCRAALAEVRRTEPRLARWSLETLWLRYLDRLHASDQTLGTIGHRPATYEEARAERFRGLATELGWAATPGDGVRLATAYQAHYRRLRRPIPGAVDLVRRLARQRLVGVITNNRVAEQEEKLRFLGIRESVDPLIISEAVGVEKPDPRIFEAALRASGVRAREALMVGDSWSNDVVGARRVGMRAVWFNRFGRPPATRHRATVLSTFRPPRAAEASLLGPSVR